MYDRGLTEPIYSKIHFQRRYGPGQGPDLRGAVHVLCDMERELSRPRVLWTSAGGAWAIRVSSAARNEAQREGRNERRKYQSRGNGGGGRRVGGEACAQRESRWRPKRVGLSEGRHVIVSADTRDDVRKHCGQARPQRLVVRFAGLISEAAACVILTLVQLEFHDPLQENAYHLAV